MPKPIISYIGTGAMGRPMITKLLSLGYKVNVFDKYKEAARPILQ